MWPRLISRGKGSPCGPGSAGSPCFNVAAADQPRKVPDGLLGTLVSRASMWPRLISRGKARLERREAERQRASMWPRLISRGKNLYSDCFDLLGQRFNV